MSREINLDNETARPLFEAYNEEIRSLAREAVKITDDEERDDWIREACDGHEWIIYTWKARCVLVCTDNPDAFEEDMGCPPSSPESAACAAMMRDVSYMVGVFQRHPEVTP